MKISLGFSTCPNDTFIFDALVNNRIPSGDLEFEVLMEDILHLNKRAISGGMDLIKASYATFGLVTDQYQLLNSGSALGNNCGPLLIAPSGTTFEEFLIDPRPIAIPGRNTTAFLLLNYFNKPLASNTQEMTFEKVMPSVLDGSTKGGVIIHENRFTYQNYPLLSLQDLGEFWEKNTGSPIPLGGILAHKSLGKETISQLDELLRKSVEYAFANPQASVNFIKEHAQEMDQEICQAHIDLYVNQYSVHLGKEGLEAVDKLLEVGEKAELFPKGVRDNFAREQIT